MINVAHGAFTLEKESVKIFLGGDAAGGRSAENKGETA